MKRTVMKVGVVFEAAADERARFNDALYSGKVAILQTAFGPYRVVSVSGDWWYNCYPADRPASEWNRRSFAGCNDGAWADLMKQAGVERNPRWR